MMSDPKSLEVYEIMTHLSYLKTMIRVDIMYSIQCDVATIFLKNLNSICVRQTQNKQKIKQIVEFI